MNISIKLYNIDEPVGMMPGMAINNIISNIGGKLIEAGLVTNPPQNLESHGIYYLRAIRGGQEAESIWIDDGCSVTCVCFNLSDDKGWIMTEAGPVAGYNLTIPTEIKKVA